MLAAHCRPADPRALAVELKRTLDIFPPHTSGDPGALSDALMEALEDVPLDIAQTALRRVRMECRFTPRPAEIRERVIAELGERKRMALKAAVAADMARRRKEGRPPRPATEAEKAQVSEMLAKARTQHQANPLKGAPEPTVGPTDTATALRAVKAQTAGFKLPSVDDPAVRKWMGAA